MNNQQKSVAMQRIRSIFGLIASVIIAQTTVNWVVDFVTSGTPSPTLSLGLNGLFATIYAIVTVSVGLELSQWVTDNSLTKQQQFVENSVSMRAQPTQTVLQTPSGADPQAASETLAFCGYCGNNIPVGLRFCPACGKPKAVGE